MCAERFSRGTASDRLQNRRLDFQKAALLEEAPGFADNCDSFCEHRARMLVRKKIQEMALAHVAMGGDAARRTKAIAFFKFFTHLCNGSAYVKTNAERLDTFCTERVQFFSP